MIQFFAHGIPKGQPRPRAVARKMGGKYVARVYDDATAEGWKSAVAMAWKQSDEKPLPSPYCVALSFYMPMPKSFLKSNGELKPSAPRFHSKKPDADNLAKAVLDALSQVGAWKDDAEVAVLYIRKEYSQVTGCKIEIQSIQNESESNQ